MKHWLQSLAALPLAIRLAPQLKNVPRNWHAQSDQRLQSLIAHCWAHSSFYREQWAASRLQPEQIQRTADLTRLPVISRATWRVAAPESFGDSPRSGWGGQESSSGTSGTRFTMPYSWNDVVTQRALIMAVYMTQGVPWFGLFNWNLSRSTSADRWRHSGRVLTISARLPNEDFLAAIRHFKPHLVRCSPWQAWRAVVGALRTGSSMPQVPILVAGSEVVPSVLRRTLESYLAARLVNHYGASDSGHLATECVAGRLHTCWPTTHLEVLADNDKPAQPGTLGEVVVTNLVLRRRPVVRVRTGDMAILSGEPCPCGSPVPHLAYVTGRQKDRLRLPDGQTLHWSDLETELAECGPNLLGYQIEQINLRQILFRLCVLEPAAALFEFENRLRRRLRGLEIEFVYTDDFQRSPTGKTLPLIGLEL